MVVVVVVIFRLTARPVGQVVVLPHGVIQIMAPVIAVNRGRGIAAGCAQRHGQALTVVARAVVARVARVLTVFAVSQPPVGRG